MEQALAAGQRALDAAAAAQADGDLSRAGAQAARAVRALRRGLGPTDPNVAPAWLAVGHLRSLQGDERGAASALARAVALLRPVLRDEGALTLWLEASVALAHARIALGRYAEAHDGIRAALRVARRRRGPGLELAQLLNAYGKLCKYTARFGLGLRAYHRALALCEEHDPGGDDRVAVLHNLGGLHHARGDFAAAEPHARRAIALRAEREGPDGVGVAVERAAWAPIAEELGQPEAAAAALRDAASVFRRAGMTYDLAVALHNLAPHEADPEPMLREAIRLKVGLLGPDHPDVALTEHNLAVTLAEARPDDARALLARARRTFARTLGERHPHTKAADRALAGLPAR